MSAALHNVLPTSVLAPKTTAVRRAAILFFAPLASVVRTRPLQGGGLCRRYWAVLLNLSTAEAITAAKDAHAVLFWQFLALYGAGSRSVSAG